MAITVTTRGNYSNGSAATLASSSFTPANNSLLIAVGFMWDTNASGNRLTFSDSFADTGGGVWTSIVNNDLAYAAFGATLSVRAYRRQIGTSPGAHTVVANGNASAPDNVVFTLVELAGAYAAAPVPTGQTKTAIDSTGTLAMALPATPDAASIVFACAVDVPNGTPPATPASYTNLIASSPFGDGINVSYDLASAAASVSFTGLDVSYPNQGLMFEIAAVPTTPVPGFAISDNFGDTLGGPWTKATGLTAGGAEVAIWFRKIGNTPAAGTVTATAGSTTQGRSLSVVELAHRNNDNPVPTGQAQSAQSTTATDSVTLPASPSADSIMVAGLISRGDASAPGTPTGHNSLTNVSTGGDGYSASDMPGPAGATASWSGLATTQNIGAYAEIRSVSTGPITPPGGGGGGGGGGGSGGQPFSSNSTWNTPIPAGASFVDEPSLRNTALGNPGSRGWIEDGAYAVPVIRSTAADPLVTVHINDFDSGGGSWGYLDSSYTINIPNSAQAASGTDGSLCIVTPSGEVYDFWQFHKTGTNTAFCQSAAHTNLSSDGWAANCSFPAAGIHASGSSLLAGLMVGNEMTQGINHTLAIAIRFDLCPATHICPSIHGDGTGGVVANGTRVGIPPNVPMPAGMPVQTQSIWKAMQKYGGFVIDTHGATQPIEWWCDLNSINSADVAAAMGPGFDQLNPIVDNLRIVH